MVLFPTFRNTLLVWRFIAETRHSRKQQATGAYLDALPRFPALFSPWNTTRDSTKLPDENFVLQREKRARAVRHRVGLIERINFRFRFRFQLSL